MADASSVSPGATVARWHRDAAREPLTFVPWVEINPHKNETWMFWLQVNGNQRGLAQLDEVARLAADDWDETPYGLDLVDQRTEAEVDLLIRYGACGHFDQFVKVCGRLDVPRNLDIEQLDAVLGLGKILDLFADVDA